MGNTKNKQKIVNVAANEMKMVAIGADMQLGCKLTVASQSTAARPASKFCHCSSDLDLESGIGHRASHVSSRDWTWSSVLIFYVWQLLYVTISSITFYFKCKIYCHLPRCAPTVAPQARPTVLPANQWQCSLFVARCTLFVVRCSFVLCYLCCALRCWFPRFH